MVLLIIFLLLISIVSPANATDENEKRVFLLNAYHQSFSWNENIYKGVKDVLEPSPKNIKLFVENMDTKRFRFDAEKERLLTTLYAYKYKELPFDLVIVADNNAFDFMRSHGDEIFPGVPVVFCGVNNFKPEMLADHPLYTGVPEVFDVGKTIGMAKLLHPGMKEIYVLNDYLPSGIAIGDYIRSALSAQNYGLRITYAGNWPISRLLERIKKLPSHSIIFLGTYFRDNTGQFYTPHDVGEILSEASPVPIYAYNSTYFGHGIMGGYLISGYYQGRAAAELGLRILGGESPADIPVMASGANRYMFDHAAMDRFNVAKEDLPEGSILINESYSFYDQYTGLFWSLAGFILLLMLIIGLLGMLVMVRRRSEGALKRAHASLKKSNRDLRRSNEELKQFAYVASHDLQEPLRMVASYTQLLARRYQGRLDQDADDFIGYAVDGANRMKSLIDDLLHYSRVETQGKALQPTDANEALGDALYKLQAAIQDSGASIAHPKLPDVLADRAQLSQLFQNLISNAIKFRGDNPPIIRITTKESNGDILFQVADNGIGMESRYLERIFVIFQRLHSKTKYEGTGIGLAICKRIVERHGGRIWAESQLEKGTSFFFTFRQAKG